MQKAMARKRTQPRGPRSIWTGSITFGLVNVPVRVFTAVHEHKLSFHLVHEKDDGPIGYQKICKTEDKPDTYLVAPQDDAERAYALLVRAMEESGLAGIGKFVMRNRQYLGCLRVRDGVITLEQMYFADEVDAPESVVAKKLPTVDKRQLDMALSLVESFTGDWEPKKYKDTYHDELVKVIEAKRKGREIRQVREPEEEGPPDLMEALRLSLERTGTTRKKSTAKRSSTKRRPSRARSR